MQKQSLTRPPAQAGSLLLSVPAARAALGGMGNTWFYEQVKAGRIRTVKLGTRTMVPVRELERFVNDVMQEAA